MDLRSDRSPWRGPTFPGTATAGPLSRDERCDVLIVGSGISGAMTAFHLARAGVDVVVVDRRSLSGGSTLASTALIQYELDVPMVDLIPRLGLADAQAVYRATRRGLDDLRELVDANGLDCELVQRPSLFLARAEADVVHLQHEALARSQIGIEVAWLDADALRSRYGLRRPGAIRSSVSYELDPRKLTDALLAGAVARGVRLYDRTRLVPDPWIGATPTLRTDNGHTIRAGHVVYATGYETPEQFPALAPLCTLRSTFALLTQPLDPVTLWPERAMLWELGDPYLYARTVNDGADARILIGGEDVATTDPRERDAMLPEKTRRLLEQFGALVGRSDLVVDRSWAATFAATADGLPFIGSADCASKCFFTLGFAGNGILFALIGAQIIRDAILNRYSPTARLFGFDRASSPISGKSLAISCPG